MVKNPPAKAGDMGSIPGLGRSLGEGNGNPLLNYRNFIIKTVATHKKSKISTTPYIPIPTCTHTK